MDNDPSIFVPKIREELYKYFTEELPIENRNKIFYTDPNDMNLDKDNDAKITSLFKKEILKKLVWKKDDRPELLMQLWNQKVYYAKYPPKLAVSKTKESDKLA